jgi:NADPH:quinone reductase-like Zn-dependent oxidoreductase
VLTEVEKALKRNGMYGISEDEYLRTMELACRRREDLSAPTWGWDECAMSHIVTGMDPTRVSRAGGKSLWLHDNRLRNLVMAMGGLQDSKGISDTTAASKTSTLQAIAGLGKEALKAAVSEHLLQKFSKLVLIPTSKMVISKPLAFYGMDSMIGAEIRNWAWKELHTDIPFLSLLDQTLTLEGLAQQVFEVMTAETEKPADGKTQKAIVMAGPREANLVTDRSIPKLRDDYILVKTEAVALNPTDWKHIDFASTRGALSGCDYAGVVEEVGSQVTKPFKKGDRITGFVHGGNQMQPEDGTFAEFILVKGDLQIRVPDRLTFEEAATLGVGITSVGQGLYQTQMLAMPTTPSSTPIPILIYGGSTASGVLGIQFAKLSGYLPITTCSPHNFAMVKQLGAVAAFDRRDPATAKKVKEYTKDGLTLVWDTISSEASAQFCADVMSSQGGRYAALLPVHCPRHDIESTSTLAYTVFGETIMDRATVVPGRVKDFEFAKMWWALCEDLLRDGRVVPHVRPRLGSGGLAGVLDGLQLLREGKISGEKLVYRVGETT